MTMAADKQDKVLNVPTLRLEVLHLQVIIQTMQVEHNFGHRL